MQPVMRLLLLGLGLALLLGGCREELGVPDYTGHTTFPLDAGPVVERLPGTDPYIPGQRRLNLGLFYEGAVSERFLLSPERLCLREPHVDPLRCYLIFASGSMPAVLHYEQDTVTDRVEGVLSDRFTLNGTPFWGGGVLWDAPTDLSGWSTLHLALKSSDESFAVVNITMQSGVGEAVSAFDVAATDYGYANDGEWHAMDIPLTDFEGLDPINVRAPFLLGGTGNTAGDELLVDEVYMTQDLF